MTTRRIGYLVNQYPKVSHSFIRSEILELERQGWNIDRFALRGWDAELVEPADRAERERTRYILADGLVRPLLALASTMLRRPGRFAAALRLALTLSKGADHGLAYHLVYLAEASLMLRWTKASACHHLHVHFGTNAATVAALLRALGGPSFSFTVHGPEEFDRPLQLKLREKIERATFTVAISSFCRGQLYRWSRECDWAKIEVVHCGLDAGFLAPSPMPLPAAPTMVCVGRLCEQKAQWLLIQACALLKQRGIAFRLVLAGDGDQRELVEDAIGRAGLTDSVVITGWVSRDQVVEALSAARLFVLPSLAEGLPVVLMEAMALSRIPVTTYIAAIPELVEDGVSGFLVPAGDVERLADALAAALALDDATLVTMGAAAREAVGRDHSIAIEAAKLARLFEAAIDGDRSSVNQSL